MDVLETLNIEDWSATCDVVIQDRAVAALEDGKILYLPRLAFTLSAAEGHLLSPETADSNSKNISFDPASGKLQGSRCTGEALARLENMMRRYADYARSLVTRLSPGYADVLEIGRTSFRTVEVENRPSTQRKDDRRLHLDAFPSRPVQGRRILRVFCNVNPQGTARVWHVGEPFEDFIERFLRQVRRPVPGMAWLQQRLGITKGRRSHYDHIMLQLHDRAKLDESYQRTARRRRIEFPSGATWIVYTDKVLHAALSGQHLLEQTFYLAPAHMRDPQQSPLRLLEQRYRRALV